MLRSGRIGQRAQHVEHAGHSQRGTNRTNETHRRMEGTCESESDAALIADLGNLLRLQIKRQSQRLEAIGGAALGRSCAIAMLHDFHSGGGSHHRTHRRQVHRRSTVTASADNVSSFAGDIQWDGVPHHRLGRAAYLIGGQAELLLRGEYRAHGGGIGVTLHQIIDEPFRFLRAQMVSPNQFGENRLPCDLGHSILPLASRQALRLCFRRIF